VLLVHDGAGRNFEDEVAAVAAGAVGAFAVPAARRLEFGMEPVVNERVLVAAGGTNFSRRNARQPLPPSPASTWTSTSSTNKVIPEFGDLVIS
jgi:hypothetical protein